MLGIRNRLRNVLGILMSSTTWLEGTTRPGQSTATVALTELMNRNFSYEDINVKSVAERY
jgi:hypothetical protein